MCSGKLTSMNLFTCSLSCAPLDDISISLFCNSSNSSRLHVLSISLFFTFIHKTLPRDFYKIATKRNSNSLEQSKINIPIFKHIYIYKGLFQQISVVIKAALIHLDLKLSYKPACVFFEFNATL